MIIGLHLGVRVHSRSGTLVVTRNRKELFRKEIAADEDYTEVRLPREPGKYKAYFVVEGHEPQLASTANWKFVTTDDARRCLAEAQAFRNDKKNRHAKGKIIEAICILREFEPDSSVLVGAYLAQGLLYLEFDTKHRGLHDHIAAHSYATASALAREFGHAETLAQCPQKLSAFYANYPEESRLNEEFAAEKLVAKLKP